MNRPPLHVVFDTLAQVSAWARTINAIIRQMTDGQNVACGTVTLNANATTTTVTKAVIPAGALPFLQPASGTWTSTVMRVTTVANGSFVITHSNEAATDRIVYWKIEVPG